ncbi:heme-degrading domain-containing protein [Sphingobium sp. H39-3-25]|uniref:heme-degrading domain-containing protein n=1 Tax=Sphingobium arseniciresistens TaxID=3030834 RepID=UPI0023B8F82B|nr:heme-degrading domain-containing protein [Sphingobium arseniciresistens]
MSNEISELDRLIEQENGLILPRFSAADAWRLGVTLHDKAYAQQAPIGISIFVGPTCLFSALLPGATNDNQEWIKRKAALAWRFQQSSYVIGLKFKAGDNLFERFGLDYRTYAAAGGAVPIKTQDSGMIGVVAVSGLPQLQDHEMVIEALGELQADMIGRS